MRSVCGTPAGKSSKSKHLGGNQTSSLAFMFLQEIGELRQKVKELEQKQHEQMLDCELVKTENAGLCRELAKLKQGILDAAPNPLCGLEWQFQVSAEKDVWSGMSTE